MDRGSRRRTEALTRRTLLKTAATAAAEPAGASGRVVDLTIQRQAINIGGREATAMVINGVRPGSLLRFREGETVTLRVTNELDEAASIHWHGLLVPYDMDGVPGVSFPGIEPGATFTYRYTVRQNGTYSAR